MDTTFQDGRVCPLLKAQFPTVHLRPHDSQTLGPHILTAVLNPYRGKAQAGLLIKDIPSHVMTEISQVCMHTLTYKLHMTIDWF